MTFHSPVVRSIGIGHHHRSTGAVNDTWKCQPGLAVDCAPPSITLRPDGSPQAIGNLTVRIGPQDKLDAVLIGNRSATNLSEREDAGRPKAETRVPSGFSGVTDGT